jgi:hypothetical protein
MCRIGSHAGGSGLAIASRVETRPARIGNWRNALASIIEGASTTTCESGRSRTIKDEAMAELIIKMIASSPRQQPSGACAPSSIYCFCNPTVRIRGAIGAPV